MKIQVVRNKRLFDQVCLGIVLCLELTGMCQPLEIAAVSPRKVARVKTGIFEYRDTDHGKNVGRSKISIRQLPNTGNLRFTNKADFSDGFSGFQSQRWEAVTAPNFQPILARLSFFRGNELVPIFELGYEPGKVIGFLMSRRDTSAQGIKQAVEMPVPDDIVDQRIDWAAILASNLEAGGHIEFNVFDPITGVSHVTAVVGPFQRIQVPAGTFSSYQVEYQIEKQNRTEHYRLFVSAKCPRIMLREDFPNGVVSELVRNSEAAMRPSSCRSARDN